MGQRGAVWWEVWTIAVVFLGVYIGFEVLDLDGSQLQLRSGVALTVESASVEADRSLRVCPIPLAVRLQPYLLALHTMLPLRPVTRPGRPLGGKRLLPRRQLAHVARLMQSADPV